MDAQSSRYHLRVHVVAGQPAISTLFDVKQFWNKFGIEHRVDEESVQSILSHKVWYQIEAVK